MQVAYVVGHEKTETIIGCRKRKVKISDLKFERNKRFNLSYPALLCFRSPKSNSALIYIEKKKQFMRSLVVGRSVLQ